MTKKFLEGAYQLENSAQTKQLYKEWAASYDDELLSQGYQSPLRTAEALLACGAPLEGPVLDVGCGSGVSGVFLDRLGFQNIQGSDFSAEMLAEAERKKIYSALHLADFDDPFDFIQTPFKVIAAVGVFSIGHAGADVLETIVELMPADGYFGFSLNDHALDDGSYMDVINRLLRNKAIRVRWQDYGHHVKGIGLNSMIVVLQKR